MPNFVNDVKFTSATVGLADFTIGVAANGFQLPTAAGGFDPTKVYSYTARTASGQFESGTGICNGATQARTTILDGSSGPGVKVNFLTAPVVILTVLASDLRGAPQVTVLTAGSGTYTPPAGALYVLVELVGGGGGGAGSGTTPGNGGNGGNSTFGALTASGGVGATAGSNNGAAGGAAAGGDVNIQGGGGGAARNQVFTGGGYGGCSFFSGGAPQGNFGTPPSATPANSGAGGTGAGSAGTAGEGAGGGAGGYVRKLFAPPATSYAYSVGVAGTVGNAGTGGAAGIAGAAGMIIATAFFQ